MQVTHLPVIVNGSRECFKSDRYRDGPRRDDRFGGRDRFDDRDRKDRFDDRDRYDDRDRRDRYDDRDRRDRYDDRGSRDYDRGGEWSACASEVLNGLKVHNVMLRF